MTATAKTKLAAESTCVVELEVRQMTRLKLKKSSKAQVQAEARAQARVEARAEARAETAVMEAVPTEAEAALITAALTEVTLTGAEAVLINAAARTDQRRKIHVPSFWRLASAAIDLTQL